VEEVGLADDEVMALADQFLLSEGNFGRNGVGSVGRQQGDSHTSVESVGDYSWRLSARRFVVGASSACMIFAVYATQLI
jgi:hypothetical protein